MAQLSTSTKNKYGRKRFSTHLDMTPMVDLAFLLLTFFVLTMTLNDAFVMPVQAPDQDDNTTPRQAVKAERVLTLILGERDKIYWFVGNDAVKVTQYSRSGIRKLLFNKNASIPKMVVLIKPSPQSRYKNLVDILDEVKLVNINDYYIVKETPEDQQRIAALGF